MTATDNSTPLGQQLGYYRARAAEYDQWWLRQGRYDRGEALNAQWFADAAVVSSALNAFCPAGRVLEFACGTGIWSEQLLPFASHLTALDGSPEMLAINAARLRSPSVRYVEADLFQWQPTERFDTVFFGFWLSHVPPERFAEFWRLVRSCLAPGGRVFFVDSRHEQTSTAVDHHLPKPEATVLRRRLNDGREFQIYKVFYDATDLTGRLRELGWRFDIRQTDHYFIYGSGDMLPFIRQATRQDTQTVAEILREAAQWLEQSGMAMWQDDELVPSRIAADVEAGLFFIAGCDGGVAGVVKFQLEDRQFWPDVPPSESAFVHRLAVRRRFAGGGISSAMLSWAVERARSLHRDYLRLDCEASRPKLRAVYERFGFVHHSDQQVGPYFVSRYEYRVT